MLKNHIMSFICVIVFSSSLSAKRAIIILGPPGSGKGTQTVLLHEALRLPLISGTNIMREERIKKSILAKIRDENIASKDINNFLKLGLIVKRLAEIVQDESLTYSSTKIIILDNWPKFPLALELARASILGDDEPLVIELVVDRERLIERAAHRLICPNSYCGKSYAQNDVQDSQCHECEAKLFQRASDDKAYFPLRLNKFYNLRQTFYRSYEKFGYKIHQINGDQDKNLVHAEIVELASAYIKNF